MKRRIIMKRPKLKKIIEKKLPHHFCKHCGIILMGEAPNKKPEQFCYLCRKEHGVGMCHFCRTLLDKGYITTDGRTL